MKETLARGGLLALLLWLCAASCQFRHAPPLLDDVDESDYIQGLSTCSELLRCDCYGLFRPVKNLLFYGVMKRTPDTPEVRHGLSVGLYLVVVALSFVLFRRLLSNELWALAATAIYALAPSQWAVVAWFSGINNLTMMLGCWLALWAYDQARAREQQRPRSAAGWLLVARGAYLLALFSYESAVVLPALLLLWDGSRGRALWTRRSLGLYTAFGVIAVAYLALRAAVHGHLQITGEGIAPSVTPLQLSAAGGWFIWDHLRYWLWPFGQQSLCGSFHWSPAVLWQQVLPGWLALGALTLLAWQARGRAPMAAWGAAWFFVAFFPTSNLIPLRNSPFAECYLAVPSFGLALAVTALVRAAATQAQLTLAPSRRSLWVGMAALLLAWRAATAVESWHWARAWHSAEQLFSRNIQARPEAFSSAINLARIYMLEGRLDMADQLIQRAQVQAPWATQAWLVLGDLRLRQQRAPEAQLCFEKAAGLRPGDAYPHLALASLFESLPTGAQRAIDEYHKVLQFPWTSYSVTAALNLSGLLATRGQIATALQVVEQALQKAPTSTKLHYNAALAYKQKGDLIAAARHFQAYQELQRRETSSRRP